MKRISKSPFFKIYLVSGIPYTVLSGLWYGFAEPPFYYLIFWTLVLGFLYAMLMIGVLWLWTRLFRRSIMAIIFLILVSAIIGAAASPLIMYYSPYIIPFGHWEKLELNIPQPISIFCLDQDDIDRASNIDVFYIDTQSGQLFKVVYNKGGGYIYFIKVIPAPVSEIKKEKCIRFKDHNLPIPPGIPISRHDDCLSVSETGSCTRFILLRDGSIWQWTGGSIWPLDIIAGMAHILLGFITGVVSSLIISFRKNQGSWRKPKSSPQENQ
jgi:hypothetical protein